MNFERYQDQLETIDLIAQRRRRRNKSYREKKRAFKNEIKKANKRIKALTCA